jgi:hypothetical protein
MGRKKKRQKILDNGQLLLTVTDKRQTRILFREGASQRPDCNFQTELISGRKSHSGLDPKTYWLTVSRNATSTSASAINLYAVER